MQTERFCNSKASTIPDFDPEHQEKGRTKARLRELLKCRRNPPISLFNRRGNLALADDVNVEFRNFWLGL
jgi:hypothetical protein